MSLTLPEHRATVPIATECTNSATLSLHWFVERTEYDPAECAFAPLVNGQEAFGAIHEAISNATKSIDILCWGFQPSMHFKRGYTCSESIGELLERKARRGVKVRLLRWDDPAITQLDEDPAPGTHLLSRNNQISYFKSDLRTYQQREFDELWYRRAHLCDRTQDRLRNSVPPPSKDLPVTFNVNWPDLSIPNLDHAKRGFDAKTRQYIGDISQSKDIIGAEPDRAAGLSSLAMQHVPSHHQKMVLVDYDAPDKAVGFVMGHNMLDAYWDDDRHSATRRGPTEGRNGATPRHDISSRVHGPMLMYLNKNFCQAWDDATGQHLTAQRQAFDTQHKAIATCFRSDGSVPVMAQLLRTQPQYQKKDILTVYRKAVNNATQFIYIENQYFRFPQLAEQIKHTITTQCNWGRDPDQHGPLHLFVITNASDEGIGKGTLRTYTMLQALGQGQTMPKIAYGEQKDNLQQQYQQACNAEQRANATLHNNQYSAFDSPAQVEAKRAQHKVAKAQLQQAQEKQADLQQQMHQLKEPDSSIPTEIKGLKVHVCSLVAPDSPAGNWMPVYIHAKLMIVDDCFTTLGSANINVRSMVSDSELNICHETSKATRPLRERLWKMHTAGKGMPINWANGMMDAADAFEKWGVIIKENKRRKKDGKEPPMAPLVGFLYTGSKRSILD